MSAAHDRPSSPGPTDYRGGDIAIRVLVYVAAGLALLVVLSWFANRVLFDLLETRAVAREAAPAPFAGVDVPRPQPMLQVTPALDLQAMQEEMDGLLNAYEWVDPERGLVRIPIERAMEVVAAEGLPDFTDGPGGAR